MRNRGREDDYRADTVTVRRDLYEEKLKEADRIRQDAEATLLKAHEERVKAEKLSPNPHCVSHGIPLSTSKDDGILYVHSCNRCLDEEARGAREQALEHSIKYGEVGEQIEREVSLQVQNVLENLLEHMKEMDRDI